MATDMNYRNAYKLAVRTNRELHAACEAYASLLESAKQELARAYDEINRLRAQTPTSHESLLEDQFAEENDPYAKYGSWAKEARENAEAMRQSFANGWSHD